MNAYSPEFVGGHEYALPAPQPIPATWLVGALACSGIMVAAMMAWAGLLIATRNFGFVAALALMAPLALGRWWLRRADSPRSCQLRDFCEDAFLFLAMSLLGVLASYPAAAATTGFSDAALARVDGALHFDWTGWYRVVAAHAWLQRLGAMAYAAIYVSPMLLIGYFAAHQRRAEARRFLGTFWLAVVLTLALFPLFPAEGPLAYLWHGPIPYMPTSALYQQELITALRAHRVTDIDLGALRGLVCAPSFHTASAVVFITAAWPIPRLRWVILPLNLAMLLATPVEGTHYLTDMIIGALVAVTAVAAVRLVLARRGGTGAGKAGSPPMTRAREPMTREISDALIDRGLRNAYDARPPYQRNDYLRWIKAAKGEDTQARRLEQMLDELADGGLYMKAAWQGR